MDLIIIAGMPSAGKTTLARKLSEQFGYPILEKDEMKEMLFDHLGYADRIEKRKLDYASNAILLQTTEKLLQKGVSLIIVNNFRSDAAKTVQAMISRCGCKCVNVFLGGDADVLYQRYVERDKQKLRHQGHTFIDRYPPQPGDDVNRSMTRQDFADIFEKQGMAEFKMECTRIDVDATYPEKVDMNALLAQIKEALV
ncbi:MAG: ATP-binding protein [Clostridia bacterium]|nr:ATP-binding protein [Clostridia bacterium]